MTAEKSTLIQVIETAISRHFEDIHTCLPGRVEAYDFKTRKAEVKPLISKKYLDKTILELPVIGNVPMVFPTSTLAGITFPIKRGDKCLLVFAERSLERYLLTGELSEPGDKRRYDLTDAIGIPGLYSFAEKSLQSNNNDLEIHQESQKITIKKNGDIEIGTQALKKLLTEDFINKFNNHVHTASSFGTPTTTPQDSSTYPAPVIAGPTDLTSKVKAQ